MPDKDIVLSLVSESESAGCIKPLNEQLEVIGKSVGYWTKVDGNIIVVLTRTIEVIEHEIATRKSIEAEIRSAEHDFDSIMPETKIIYNPETNTFSEVEV